METRPIVTHTSTTRPTRLGLSLSGGGFRAAFFHVGLLARLADWGLLRQIEVISTVSGGAIVGTLYYLHLKRLLETKMDAEITDDDYREIVQRLTTEFFQGTQRNIIMTAYSQPFKTLQMTSSHYSSSLRLAELYEEIFYRPFATSPNCPLALADLQISPLGTHKNFSPLDDNAKRQAKVPILIINATSLNTGRGWRFTPTYMGEYEHRGEADMDIDKNPRLERSLPYHELNEQHQKFPLAQAVAASACLPGVFTPITIENFYPNGINVELVDGGVYDNQGLQALLDLQCSHFIVSDACKPMEFQMRPDRYNNEVLLRVRSILAERVREEQLYRLLQHHQIETIFIHLRKYLPVLSIPCVSESGVKYSAATVTDSTTLIPHVYNIDIQVQQRLAQLRTHLDSFTEVEAYSLMLYSYRLSKQVLLPNKQWLQPFILTERGGEKDWCFSEVAPWVGNPTSAYLKQLAVGQERFLKVFRLHALARRISLVILFLMGAAFIAGFYLLISFVIALIPGNDLMVFSLRQLGEFFVIGWFIRGCYRRLFARARQRFARFWSAALIPALSFPLVWLHLYVYDPLFLKIGKIESLALTNKETGSLTLNPDL